jgi:hypothetical protein
MPQTRILRDGSKAIASTIYLKEKTDKGAKELAKAVTTKRKKISKSAILVATIEEKFPP